MEIKQNKPLSFVPELISENNLSLFETKHFSRWKTRMSNRSCSSVTSANSFGNGDHLGGSGKMGLHRLARFIILHRWSITCKNAHKVFQSWSLSR